MTQVAVTKAEAQMLEKVLLGGDLSSLPPAQRVEYYNAVCSGMGLNPLTKPFEYIQLNGKLVLYAGRNCTDQLRSTRNITLSITARERHDDLYVVTARAQMPDGRADESIGAVPLGNLKGEQLANALMRAETKAKRRVTLSICGLSFADESEVSSIPNALPVKVDTETGEIMEGVAPSGAAGKAMEVPNSAVPLAGREMLMTMDRQRTALDWSIPEFLQWVRGEYNVTGPRELTPDQAGEAANYLGTMTPEMGNAVLVGAGIRLQQEEEQ